jgi:2-dehydro-3-deoxy-D-gluconate 5-dehydrogenase
MQTTSQSLSSLFSLPNRGALVTGGGKGIGRGIALRLSEAGAVVVAADIDVESALETVAHIERAGGRAKALRLDVAQPAECRRAVSETIAFAGHLAILVNNAGVFPFSPVDATSEELWDRTLDINLKGAFFLAQAAAKHMTPDAHGSIINIASIDALHPSGSLVHYDASKGGMLMMTRSLAAELGPKGIRVNTICPGSIATPGASAAMASAVPPGTDPKTIAAAFEARVPLRRTGTPDDIATAAVFLASDAASYVTGAHLVIDGGYLMS